MKRNAFRTIAAVIAVALLLCSCSHADGTPEIKEKNVSGRIKADDGTTVYSYEVDYPVIKIPGNKEVSKAINLNIENEIKKITEPSFDYVAQYNDFISGGTQYVSGASFSESFVKTYCDDEIISFQIMLYCHEACAMRDTEETRGITFSLKTGDTVSVYDLAADGDDFRETMITATLEQLLSQKKAGKADEVWLEDALTVLDYNGYYWYLTDEYLNILFAPGDAAPVMYGTLKVEIPLDELMNQPSKGSTASVSGVSS